MNKRLLTLLNQLKQKDLDTRQKLLDAGKLYGTYDDTMQHVHIANAKALNAIINEHGWPGISKVGLEGSQTAWLIAQHAICTPDLQRHFLKCLTEAAQHNDAPIKQVALLTDRIRFNEGRPQIYGTILDWDAQGELGCDLEDAAHVDVRREAVHLPPFHESVERQRQMIEQEGGKAPEDYEAYQEQVHLWAKEVGWR